MAAFLIALLLLIILIPIIARRFSTINKAERIVKLLKDLPGPEKLAPSSDSTTVKRLMAEEAISLIEKLSETIIVSLDLNQMAEEIVKTAARMFNAEIAVLLLLDEKTNTLNAVAGIGLEEGLAKSIHIRNGEEISGTAAKYNEIKIMNDFNAQTRFLSLKNDACYRDSLASIPITFKNQVLGVLNVSNRRTKEPFSSIDAEILKIISLQSAVALQNFRLIKEQQQHYLDTIITLANAIDARDPYTYRHSNNVTRYSVRISEELKLPLKIVEDVKYASLLHDIGKIGIKDQILLGAGKLTEEEFSQIKSHPGKGEEIIKSLPFLQEAARMVRHHHEYFDGKGYPDGLKGERIELGARILKVADSFDAMTTDRLYHKALGLDEAANELERKKGADFDPEIVDVFVAILKKEPQLLKG
jgi:putative nucleotidyltransferase with HDIG domain